MGRQEARDAPARHAAYRQQPRLNAVTKRHAPSFSGEAKNNGTIGYDVSRTTAAAEPRGLAQVCTSRAKLPATRTCPSTEASRGWCSWKIAS